MQKKGSVKIAALAGILGMEFAGVLISGMTACRTSGADAMKIVDYHNELFGKNVYIFSPEDDPAKVGQILDEIYEKQETNQFGDERYAIYFMPGDYEDSIEVKVGFYTQVAGLGMMPIDTKIHGVQCDARWLGDDPNNHNACCNFWRGAENLEIESNTTWAVSQATFMRRMQIDGALRLHDDYGWCSGGFLADSNIDLLTDSGSQQQWLARNCNWATWTGANWNMVFLGIEEGKAPEGTWPIIPYTEVEETEWIQEKPFLIYDEKEGYQVYVPAPRENAVGVSWKSLEQEMDVSTEEESQEKEVDRRIPIADFYVARPERDTAETLNAALEEGKHLFLTPGIYELESPIVVKNSNTIVLGCGLATLRAASGNVCMKTADAEGLIIAGILFDAGEKESENLLVVGEAKTDDEVAGRKDETSEEENHSRIVLSDLFFRVGGASADYAAKVKACVTINSDYVTGDNFWVWRADHGDNVAWNANTAANGIVVNGNHVSIYALMVEHFMEYQTIWNGENGKVVMYQSEIPYDVPSQEMWMSHEGSTPGYASFYVAENVKKFEAWGLGIYLYNRDAQVMLNTAMELPDRENVKVHHICTVMLNGNPGMIHVINDTGDAVMRAGERQIICEYEAGIKK